jgi:hypothetical protein
MATHDIARRTVAVMAAVAVIRLAAARRGWTNLGDPFLHPQATP